MTSDQGGLGVGEWGLGPEESQSPETKLRDTVTEDPADGAER